MSDLQFYSVAEVATLFACSEKTVRSLVRSGELQGAKFGTDYLFELEAVTACFRTRARRRAATLPVLP